MSKKNKVNLKSNIPQNKSLIGRIIDMSLEDFEKELVRQKVNIGVMHNLELHLQGVYKDLVIRKESILKRCDEGSLNINDPEVDKALKGLYAEMLKIEDKVVFLKKKHKELIIIDDIGLN